MPTPARIRRTLDTGRLREGLAGPGADTRTWVALARVDDDPDAIRWDEGTGWVVDVTITSGQLAQEGEVPCRVAASFGASGSGRFEPQLRGAEVVVLITDGDPNVGPVILGVLHNPQSLPVPSSVNGDGIDEAKALDSHILVTPYGVDEQVGGRWRVIAVEDAILQGLLVKLGENATEPLIKGTLRNAAWTTLLTAMGVYLTAQGVWVAAVGAAVPALGGPTGAAAVFATAIGAMQTAVTNMIASLPSHLSSRSRTE